MCLEQSLCTESPAGKGKAPALIACPHLGPVLVAALDLPSSLWLLVTFSAEQPPQEWRVCQMLLFLITQQLGTLSVLAQPGSRVWGTKRGPEHQLHIQS